jgi:hypothetical protein
MLGVREESLVPGQDFTVKWGNSSFQLAGLQERFQVIDSSAQPLAFAPGETPIAFEHEFKKGHAIILGGFAGNSNYMTPVEKHPLGEILVTWAGIVKPMLESSGPVELREMTSATGRFVFLFNHDHAAVHVKLTRMLERRPQQIFEIIGGEEVPIASSTTLRGGKDALAIQTEVPGESVRVYRIIY